MPRSRKAYTTKNWLPELLPKLQSRLVEKLNLFFQHLKTTEIKGKIIIASELMIELHQVEDILAKCCRLAFRQPLPDKQLILMTDANFQAAGYAALTREEPNQKNYVYTQNLCPSSIRFQNNHSLKKMTNYGKNFLAKFFAFKEFGHTF